RTEAAQHHAGAFVPHELVHAPVARVERVERRGLVRERGLTPVVLPGPEVGELLVAQAPSGYDGVGVPALVTVTHRVDDGECARERSRALRCCRNDDRRRVNAARELCPRHARLDTTRDGLLEERAELLDRLGIA